MCLTALLTLLLLCRFDIVNMLKLGCVSNGSYLSNLRTAAILVLMVGAFVGAIYKFEMQALDRVDYQSDNKQARKDLEEPPFTIKAVCSESLFLVKPLFVNGANLIFTGNVFPPTPATSPGNQAAGC